MPTSGLIGQFTNLTPERSKCRCALEGITSITGLKEAQTAQTANNADISTINYLIK
jgi:hypothetical protein